MYLEVLNNINKVWTVSAEQRQNWAIANLGTPSTRSPHCNDGSQKKMAIRLLPRSAVRELRRSWEERVESDGQIKRLTSGCLSSSTTSLCVVWIFRTNQLSLHVRSRHWPVGCLFNGTSTQKGQFVPTACGGGKLKPLDLRLAMTDGENDRATVAPSGNGTQCWFSFGYLVIVSVIVIENEIFSFSFSYSFWYFLVIVFSYS